MTITTPHAKAKVSLKPQKLVSKIAGLVLATISATSAALPTFLMLSDTASAANSCQCTDYVSRKFGNFRYPAHAGDWDTNVLPQAGFSRLPGVQVGAVVVMERSFPGSNSQFGHVGIVESILPDGRINVRGANQFVGGGLFTEVNCLNVRVTTFRTSVTGRNDVSFWRRGGGGVIDGVRQVNFSARTAPGGVNVRSGPST
ncbi:MAG: CHAP domain-containing protein, partial [Flavobacteriales bacterium]|nr:CHAP domain-containing protein [Flavobacteriales bacterium]